MTKREAAVLEIYTGTVMLEEDDRKYTQQYIEKLLGRSFSYVDEYSCAATPQIRQTGNRLSGLAETAYASLLAQCFV
jgi:hypothetical protein